MCQDGWLGEPPVPILTDPQALGGGLFGCTIKGTAGLVVVIEASTNLATWMPIQTNALVNG